MVCGEGLCVSGHREPRPRAALLWEWEIISPWWMLIWLQKQPEQKGLVGIKQWRASAKFCIGV